MLTDVSFALRSGECLSIIGPNGSGKTTLLLTLLGLLRPQSGRIALQVGAGQPQPIGRLAPRQRAAWAALAPQTLEALPAFRVIDVVAAGRHPHVPPLRALSRADEACIRAALQRCGIEALALRPVNAISAGERQKVLLAAALAQDPQVLFLDEPNTALDPAHQGDLLRLLREWHAGGRALVLVSHDLHFPALLGGRVIALRDGQVATDGDVSQVLQPDVLRSVYGAEFEEVTTADARRLVIPRWR